MKHINRVWAIMFLIGITVLYFVVAAQAQAIDTTKARYRVFRIDTAWTFIEGGKPYYFEYRVNWRFEPTADITILEFHKVMKFISDNTPTHATLQYYRKSPPPYGVVKRIREEQLEVLGIRRHFKMIWR